MRLTLLYTTLFAACGAVLVIVTYALLSHNLQDAAPDIKATNAAIATQQCVAEQTAKNAVAAGDAKAKCAALYANGVKAGAKAQRNSTLNDLLLYSLITLGGVTVLAAGLGWYAAGRILRPVHQLTAAARQASEQNLSHRLALQGPRDELRELADTFDDMLARLDDAFTAQRQFIANASHELRTPLTVMRTSIDVVLGKAKPTPDELTSMAVDVRASVDSAEALISALLTLARSERNPAASEALDLATITEDALEGRAPSQLTILTTLDAAPVTGDAVLLERLVYNLIENAEQYNVPGGTIAISTSNIDESSSLRVVNTGPVVPSAQVDRLFLPFTRVRDRTRHEGFGLGLALVQAIATAHHGTVTANAIPTGGLDVTVQLPRRQDHRDPA